MGELRGLLSGPVEQLAPRLLGARLMAGGVTVRLTEVEAYAGEGEDPGSHAHRGRTPRTEVMFGPAGHAYVYLSYGMHWCLNVVVGPEGRAAAVLLRGAEVVDGLEAARARRPGSVDRDLCRGPARLTRALGVTGGPDGCGGLDLLDPGSAVRLLDLPGRTDATGVPDASGPEGRAALGITCGPRVGVAGAGAQTPWRFWLVGDPTVSAYRAAVPRRR